MTTHQEIFSVLLSLTIFVVIIFLVRNGKLKEEYSWLWLLTSLLVIFLVLWHDMLEQLASLVGAVSPTTTMIVFSIIFLVFMVLHFAIEISKLSERVKNLAQKISILEAQTSNQIDNL